MEKAFRLIQRLNIAAHQKSENKRKPTDADGKGAAASFVTKPDPGAQTACPQKTAHPVYRDT